MFSKLLKRTKRAKISAQGMTEYIIIVGLIAIFVLAAVKAFGTTVNAAFAGGTVKVDKDVNGAIKGTQLNN